MIDDTKKLLKECNAGCKSATNSIEQVIEFVKDSEFKELLENYNKKHIDIGDKCHELLNNINEDEKDPKIIAKTMAWFSTEIKLMLDNTNAEISDLLIDGCNMGIKSLNKYINSYPSASSNVIDLTKKLIEIEENMREDLYKYL